MEFINAKAAVSKQLSSQSSILGQKRKASQVSKITPVKPAKRVKKQTKISKDHAEVRETFGKADLQRQQMLFDSHKLQHTTAPLPEGPHILPFEECPHKVGNLVIMTRNPPEDRLNITFHTVRR